MRDQTPADDYPHAAAPTPGGSPPAGPVASTPVPPQPAPPQGTPMPPPSVPVAMPMGPARVTVSAGTAFKIGFFGFLGALLAAVIIGALVSCVFAILGTVFINEFTHSF